MENNPHLNLSPYSKWILSRVQMTRKIFKFLSSQETSHRNKRKWIEVEKPQIPTPFYLFPSPARHGTMHKVSDSSREHLGDVATFRTSVQII